MSILDVIAPAVAEAERIEAGGEVRPNEVAALLRFNADLVVDYAEALRQEREHNAGLVIDCEEMCNRLSRLDDHLRSGALFDVLRKLADYAGGFKDFEMGIAYEDRDDPPQDPFPPPAPVKAKRSKRPA